MLRDAGETPPGPLSISGPPMVPNRFLHALRLQMAGIVTLFLGFAAIISAIIVSDIDALMIGSMMLSVGVAWIVWGWYKLNRLAKLYPWVVSMFPPPTTAMKVPSRLQRQVIIAILAISGVFLLIAGVLLLLESEDNCLAAR